MRASSRSPSEMGLVSNEEDDCFLNRATARSKITVARMSRVLRREVSLNFIWPRFSGLSQPGRAIPPKGVINKLGRKIIRKLNWRGVVFDGRLRMTAGGRLTSNRAKLASGGTRGLGFE
ncbi:hypothetical protein KQX54_018445 [Cotesia glomerata]|uniref:Uncharacterized protein n=1 Tax=Cotesia glomerata TaxID=32391 RepID=A0AAV7IRZ7_COTGL|nr:hypothetical protein KQX54_018445 [Cotesia glomerata]